MEVAVEEPVGHAGDIVGDTSPQPQRFDPLAIPRGHFSGVVTIPAKQLSQLVLSLLPYRHHPLGAVNLLKQEPLKLAFAGGNAVNFSRPII